MKAKQISPIQEWVLQTIPEKLWHYTSMQGFMGIVSGRKIFASNVRFLNDREEFIHGLKIAQEIIEGLDEVDANGWKVRQQVKKLVDGFFGGALSHTRLQVFVTSFSTAEDQLSQWRAYSHGTVGASIGLDLRKIRPDPKIGSLAAFAPCVYDDNKKKELISGTIKNFVDILSELWKLTTDKDKLAAMLEKVQEEHGGISAIEAGNIVKATVQVEIDKGLKEGAAELARDLLTLCALLKHSAFSEEQEWRLVLPMNANNTPKFGKRRFRAATSTLIPYMEFNLAESDEMPLTDLILGPGSDAESAVDAAQSFLISEGFSATPRPSKAPFRPW